MMAWHSNYFDTLLASGMEEPITKQVTLEDVSPETFELAMELIDDMGRASKATVADFLKVASFYNRFDFQNGLDRCISALVEFMESMDEKRRIDKKGRFIPTKGEMENMLATICVAAETEADRLVEICSTILSRVISFVASEYVWNVDRIRRIQGFLVNHKECMTDFFVQHPAYERLDFSDPEFPNRLAGKVQSREFSRCLHPVRFRMGLQVKRVKRKACNPSTKNVVVESERFGTCWVNPVARESCICEFSDDPNIKNICLFQIDETYEEDMECERFDWCVSFQWRGTSILLALPQSRNTPNPIRNYALPDCRASEWKHVKGFVSGVRFKLTSLEVARYENFLERTAGGLII